MGTFLIPFGTMIAFASECRSAGKVMRGGNATAGQAWEADRSK